MTLVRRANAAYDRDDFETFDRLRDLDDAIRALPTAELEALMAKPTDPTPPNTAA